MRAGAITNAVVTSSLMESVESGDLVAYGLIPEFVGRFPVLASLLALHEDQLVQVLMKPKNALGKQYKKMFKMNNVKLHFTGNALRLIARKAMAKNTGARGLRAILENILTEAMFEIPENKSQSNCVTAVLVDEEAVGLMDTPGCGAKIIHGDGALEHKLQERKVNEFKTQFSTPTFLSTQSFLLTSAVCFSSSSSVWHVILVLNFSFIIMPSPFLKCHPGALPN
ncbi:hypothetical protein OIU85_027020 [Salix viminalis]|uniref:Clp ATPase C-terminal domain-containing protein n=1 Tax=Salix viminalis TaxID=40686 RepID=A0A9Q0TQ35_SALVM|nr:hypothetical protein OIU85_027020 [Salix viminalis]